jgi:hypothetical protein
MLSKKYYEDIARILRGHKDINDLIYELATYFSVDNPRFDTERFLRACGINSVSPKG